MGRRRHNDLDLAAHIPARDAASHETRAGSRVERSVSPDLGREDDDRLPVRPRLLHPVSDGPVCHAQRELVLVATIHRIAAGNLHQAIIGSVDRRVPGRRRGDDRCRRRRGGACRQRGKGHDRCEVGDHLLFACHARAVAENRIVGYAFQAGKLSDREIAAQLPRKIQSAGRSGRRRHRFGLRALLSDSEMDGAIGGIAVRHGPRRPE